MSMSNKNTDHGFYALAIAFSAFASIGLFWAVILLAILSDQGTEVTEKAGSAAGVFNGIKITEITGGVIALFALLVAAGSLWLTRRHHRLSVKPRISIVRVVANNDKLKEGLYLRNHGLGPALIEEISFEIRSAKKTFRSYSELKKFLLPDYGFYSGDIGSYWLELLPKDACERLIWLESDKPSAKAKFKLLLNELKLTVKYRSLYEEQETEIYEPEKV